MASMTAAVLARDAVISATRARLLYVDNIRTVLITSVVLGHLAMTYGGPGDWYYHETGATIEAVAIIMVVFAALVKASLLGLFCLIAGYFTVPAYDRKGAGPFLLDRAKRLLFPLALYEIAIEPVLNYIRDVHQGSFQGSFISFLSLHFSPLRSIATGPVWFLLTLFIFSAGYAGWRALSKKLLPASQRPVGPAPGNGVIVLFTLVLGLATFVIRIWAPVGKYFEPWHQELAFYPQYVMMFAVGALANRGGWLATFPDTRGRLWRWLIPVMILALGGVAAAAGVFSGKLDDRGAGGANWLALAYANWESWTCVILTIVLLTWFRSRFDRQGPLLKALSPSAFAVYVIHPAIIVPLALGLSGITLNLSLKWLLVAPVAVALCYLVAGLLRRLPGVAAVV